MAFSPDSAMIATGSADKTVRLWPVLPPLLGTPDEIARSMALRTNLEMDERGVRVLDAQGWRQRNAGTRSVE